MSVPWRRQLPVYSPVTMRGLWAGWWSLVTGGDRSGATEAVRAFWDVRAALLTDSGTGALQLALRAACERTGRHVVALPAYACYDIATAADGAGVDVVLYDVDPATLGPVPASFARALAHRPGAVVLVHLYGVPVDVPRFAAEARAAGAVVVEDAAQGIGGWIGKQRLGALGDLGVLSFGRGKGVTAGAGGALLANTDEAVALLDGARGQLQPPSRGFREFVLLKMLWLLGRPSLFALPASLPFLRLGETIYHPPRPVRALSASALGVLPHALRLADAEAERRRAHAVRLGGTLSAAWTRPSQPGSLAATPGYLRFPVIAPTPAAAQRACDTGGRLGIMPGYPRSLADLAGFTARVKNEEESFAEARVLAERLVTMPVHGMVSEQDLRKLAVAVEG